MVLMGGSPCAVQAERKGLEELSTRGFQLRRAAAGDAVLMGSCPCAVEAERKGLEELSIRGFFGWWNILEWAVTGRRTASSAWGAQSDDRLQPTVLRGP